jgi:hypothetical protein
MKHANVESVNDEEFFEFEEVESYFNPKPPSEEPIGTASKEDIP